MDALANSSEEGRRRLDALVQRIAAARDKSAFSELFRYLAPKLKAYLIRLGCESSMAEELAQETMLAVWHRAESFDAGRSGALTWIYTIARNRRIDRLRHERMPMFDPTDPMLVPDAPQSADASIEIAEQETKLRKAIKNLPVEQADLVHMAFFEGKAHGDIASSRQLPLGTVKSRLRLALMHLRRAMKPDIEG